MEIIERLRNTPTGFVIQVGTKGCKSSASRQYTKGKRSYAGDACSGARVRDSASTARLAWPI